MFTARLRPSRYQSNSVSVCLTFTLSFRGWRLQKINLRNGMLHGESNPRVRLSTTIPAFLSFCPFSPLSLVTWLVTFLFLPAGAFQINRLLFPSSPLLLCFVGSFPRFHGNHAQQDLWLRRSFLSVAACARTAKKSSHDAHV